MSGCEFCDERCLPCLLRGAATMRHKFDRGRCGKCASANRPPREWPVFRFCPYCGRDLGNKTSEEPIEKRIKRAVGEQLAAFKLPDGVRPKSAKLYVTYDGLQASIDIEIPEERKEA